MWRKENTFTIFVKSNGGYDVFNIDNETTVDELKMMINEISGIDVDHLRLIYCGAQIEDNAKLSDYGVDINSTIYQALRLCGC